MARIPIAMPNLGFDTTEGRVAAWLKRVGDAIERGDAIAEVETEKATVEVEAHVAGTLVEIVQQPGAEVAVGEPIGYVEDGAG